LPLLHHRTGEAVGARDLSDRARRPSLDARVDRPRLAPARAAGRGSAAVITYVLRRILLMVPTLLVIGTLTFALMRLAPGGPFMIDKSIPASAKRELMRRYGLDQPLLRQYVAFLGNMARFEFGPSYKYPDRQVRDIILQGFGVSVELGAWALLLSLLIGIPVGAL